MESLDPTALSERPFNALVVVTATCYGPVHTRNTGRAWVGDVPGQYVEVSGTEELQQVVTNAAHNALDQHKATECTETPRVTVIATARGKSVTFDNFAPL